VVQGSDPLTRTGCAGAYSGVATVDPIGVGDRPTNRRGRLKESRQITLSHTFTHRSPCLPVMSLCSQRF
jgi:hypothetical protein